MEKVKFLDMLQQAKNEMQVIYKGEKTRANYEGGGFSVIQQHYLDNGIEYYSQSINDTIVADAKQKYDKGLIGRSKFRYIRKVAAILKEYYETGTLKWQCLPKLELRTANRYFTNVLDDYCEEKDSTESLAKITIISNRSVALTFMLCLEEMGYHDFSKVTSTVVNTCIPILAKRYACSVNTMMSALRSFLSFINERNISNENLLLSIATTVSTRRKVRQGFTEIEIESLLATVDRETVIGKRDYAILMIAIQTGLRAIDISNLTFSDINWRSMRFSVVQHKTGRPLSLPLEAENGNAIADYLLHGRPVCDLPYLFLCDKNPYRKMKHPFGSGIVRKYMRIAEIDQVAIPRRGFHSFRRSFGARLLEAEIPVEMLSEILGHTHIDSSKPYIAINEEGLKSCALGLAGIEVKAGELL